MSSFNHTKKIWGTSEVKPSLTYLGYLKLKYILEDLAEVKGRVLDVGCGGGGFAKAIKHYRPDLEVYGVDINKEAIKRAKKDDEGVNFKAESVDRLAFKDEFFDAVVVTDVLEHLEEPTEALRQINRVLKPKGVFCAFVPLERSLFSIHFWLHKLGWDAKKRLAGHIQNYSKKDLGTLLKESGFKVDTLRYSVHLLGQIVDVGFYSLIDLLEKKQTVGLEQELDERPIYRFFKNFVTTITSLESQILYFVPGAGVHIKCIKIKK